MISDFNVYVSKDELTQMFLNPSLESSKRISSNNIQLQNGPIQIQLKDHHNRVLLNNYGEQKMQVGSYHKIKYENDQAQIKAQVSKQIIQSAIFNKPYDIYPKKLIIQHKEQKQKNQDQFIRELKNQIFSQKERIQYLEKIESHYQLELKDLKDFNTSLLGINKSLINRLGLAFQNQKIQLSYKNTGIKLNPQELQSKLSQQSMESNPHMIYNTSQQNFTEIDQINQSESTSCIQYSQVSFTGHVEKDIKKTYTTSKSISKIKLKNLIIDQLESLTLINQKGQPPSARLLSPKIFNKT